jgi:hypothetical protein
MENKQRKQEWIKEQDLQMEVPDDGDENTLQRWYSLDSEGFLRYELKFLKTEFSHLHKAEVRDLSEHNWVCDVHTEKLFILNGMYDVDYKETDPLQRDTDGGYTEKSVNSNGISYLDIKEFREKGYLQELNRRFLHPLGLALEVVRDEDTGEETLGGIWDCRDEDEGIYYDLKNSDEERIERFEKNESFIDSEFKRMSEKRKQKLGFDIESISKNNSNE